MKINYKKKINIQNTDKLYEISSSEIFGRQKVKLYKIKHIIFDFGGVMAEKSFVLKNILDIIEVDLNIKIPRFENPYYRKLKRQLSSGRITSRDFLEKMLNEYYYPYQKKNGALPPKKVNIDYYMELWFQLHTKLTKFSSEMEIMVERLHQAGYTVNLMSNVYDIYAKSNELRGFYDVFDNVFLSNDIGLIKPNIDKYKYVLTKLEAKPKHCIFIDDKIQNLVPARELGIIVIKFESFKKFNHQLDMIGLKDVNEGFRRKIKKKYKHYKLSKKEYKKAKKDYNKAKKDFLMKKRKSRKKIKEFKRKRTQFEKKRNEFKKLKKQKKEELESRVHLN
ncbi:MAG: HAD family hydrolase [Promethearchaeota archaeon]